ncbi:MAG: FG-GAP-like repeat-containing protein [Limisphaerales bacterium]
MSKRLFWTILVAFAFLAGLALLVLLYPRSPAERFTRLMASGQGSFEKGDFNSALRCYQQAVKAAPESLDAHLNLANTLLLVGQDGRVIEQCQWAIELDPNDPAAYYVMGCAYLRQNQAGKAVQAFQQSQKIDPGVDALSFELGLALERAGHVADAIQQFETLLQFQPDHPSVHYQLSRLYQQAGRAADAAAQLAKHQELLAKKPGVSLSPTALERCKYTQPRIAFSLAQPDHRGVTVRFVETTVESFGAEASSYRGPVGVLDYNHDGRNSLWVNQGNRFRLLENSKGKFAPLGPWVPGTTNATYRRCLVGDLNNDRFEDVVVLGEQASHVFRFATNGQFREVTAAAGLKNLKARDGVLADLDFTGKLDLLTVKPDGQGLEVYRNLGSFYFQENTTNTGLPSVVPGAEHVLVDDWQNEDLPAVYLTRAGEAPVFYCKQRAGQFVRTNLTTKLPVAKLVAVGDLNNDMLPDLVLVGEKELMIVYGGSGEQATVPLGSLHPKGILLLDYDNDGWLDLLVFGSEVRVWRNVGKRGFEDVTAALGLDKTGPVDDVVAADFDQDGDTDLVMASGTGLRYWRNDGGNANKQLKLRLVGNRSNASGLGCRVELVSDHWRTIRTLKQLPFEIGVGQRDKLDLLQMRWSDLTTTTLEVPVQPQPFELVELVLPSGSCPYLYAWNGERFRFVTDILGASPLGLPVSESRYVEEDPEEYLALGNERQFPPRNHEYELRITEELREVLYLDQARLVVVDHPAGTIVAPTSKMLAGRPFPPHELWTLRPRSALKRATRSDGLDVTELLATNDARLVGPERLREPQLRGLAEPFSITLDFGELPVSEPLVLVLNGWLRFGGGMANIAGSLDPSLPFPFPILETELPDGLWKRVPVDVGVPAGKTKTILVDLENKLPSGARRLRLTTAFELYWDSVLLCVKASAQENHVTTLRPNRSDLHWRGFSEFAPLPDWLPLTPEYDRLRDAPPWRRTPFGWCTRYGAVDDLVAEKDNALVLLNGGDELALGFAADQLPPKPEGFERDFFLYVVGWDKDADFHVGQGWQVEPLPFHGMDDQAYGRQPRPTNLDDGWRAKYNTRWVGPLVLNQKRN